MSPFCVLGLWCLWIAGLARSEALRSPKGGALRAKRRARPATVAALAPRRGRLAFHASPALAALLPATDDLLAVSISSFYSRPQRSPVAHQACVVLPVQEFPPSVTPLRATRC